MSTVIMEPEQQPRFGALRAEPPPATLARLTGAAAGTTWTAERLGGDLGYPNGGMWRVAADRHGEGPASVIVKRTGPMHLGTFPVWRLRADPADPQWWGKEAAFYASDLARTGWTEQVRTPRVEIDDHDGRRDLWLEELTGIPGSLDVCRRAAAGLAAWQVANADHDHPWLSGGWIVKHVERQDLDNARTLAHPGWPSALERGLAPELRDLVAARVTDPVEAACRLAGFPSLLANHDFHNGNVGVAGNGAVAVIDWAYVGPGPVGHDAGHLALTFEPEGSVEPAEAWQVLTTAYTEALINSGWPGDPEQLRRSMIVSNQLRLGWWIDALLEVADRLSPEDLAAKSRLLIFLAELR
ncbi:phosphotransferase [Microlunatus sp. GCM10028923]|uniref:phosphotransferase n=1 Tax=Microlunatus sp. GCM10028923 TaxID=3273400 RepID=UPI0036067017